MTITVQTRRDPDAVHFPIEPRRAPEQVVRSGPTAADRIAAALTRPAHQQPRWGDPEQLAEVRADLRQLPPITVPAELARLRTALAAAARGQAFVLTGGDCAETFEGNTESHIRSVVRVLQQSAAALSYAARTPVVTVGRLAGQYAKPRSSDVDAAGLPSYRGDIVNSREATAAGRVPDPRRMIRAYGHSCATSNLLRAVTGQGGASLHDLHRRNRELVGAGNGRFDAVLEEIDRGVDLMSSYGTSGRPVPSEVFTGHEALLLDYEQPLVRDLGDGTDRVYGSSGHFLWIGERTRGLDDAHVAFLAELVNPIGIKLGPTVTPAGAAEYVERLDPHGEAGRLTLITRMGRERVRDTLPELVRAVAATGHEVVWQCDPMHGNTVSTATGVKTRHLDAVVDEIAGFFEVHRALGTRPGGIHLEMTGEDVTECLGGSREVTVGDLGLRYHTACDPRLNAAQTLEVAFLVAEMLRA